MDTLTLEVKETNAAGHRSRKASQSSNTRKRNGRLSSWWGLPFLVPAAAFVLFVILVPSVQGVVYAFTNWDGLTPVWKFVGFANFERMFRDPIAASSLAHTAILTIATAAGINLFGLMLALALNSRVKSKSLLRLVFFTPVIITPVVVANVWKFIFLPDGPLNQLLTAVGLENLTHAWLGEEATALGAVIATVIWQYTGIAMVIYLAGLQNVPTEIVEAAQIDGAGPVRAFFDVVLPQLAPAATICSLLTITAGLKTFDQVWIMTQGGPGDSSHTLSTIQYQTTFQFGDFSYGTTFAVALSVLAIAAAAAQQAIVRRKDK